MWNSINDIHNRPNKREVKHWRNSKEYGLDHVVAQVGALWQTHWSQRPFEATI